MSLQKNLFFLKGSWNPATEFHSRPPKKSNKVIIVSHLTTCFAKQNRQSHFYTMHRECSPLWIPIWQAQWLAERSARATSNSDATLSMWSREENTAFTVLGLGPTLTGLLFFSFTPGPSEAASCCLLFHGLRLFLSYISSLSHRIAISLRPCLGIVGEMKDALEKRKASNMLYNRNYTALKDCLP